jgi:uncharacterized membrane protein
MIDPETIGCYLGLIAGLYVILCGLLVLVAIPVGWVVLIVRGIKRVLKRKGSDERRHEPSAPEALEQIKKLL